MTDENALLTDKGEPIMRTHIKPDPKCDLCDGSGVEREWDPCGKWIKHTCECVLKQARRLSETQSGAAND